MNASVAQPLFSPTCRRGGGGGWGRRQIWLGQGWALRSRKDSTAVPQVTRGHYPQLGVALWPKHTGGVGRDGAAVVSYANKELAIYHLTSCGVTKHKLLPSPVFSAPGRGNMMLHIKAATRDNFQRKRLYVPKPWRPVDQHPAWYDKSARTFPSAGQGSRWLITVFDVQFGPMTDDLITYHYSVSPLEKHCLQFQGEPTQIHAIFLFPFRIIPLVFRVSMTMSSTLPVLGLCWLLAPLLRAQSFAITKLADWEHLFDSICPITAHLHSNGAHNPICFQLVTCNHVQSVCEVVSGLSIHNFCMVNKPLRT